MNKLIKELVLFVTYFIHILVLNSWSIVLFKQLVIAQLVRKFSTFYSTQRFMTVHKSLSLPPTLSWMNPVKSLSSYFLKIQFNLILRSTSKSCKLLFHWGFPPSLCIHFSSVKISGRFKVLPTSIFSQSEGNMFWTKGVVIVKKFYVKHNISPKFRYGIKIKKWSTIWSVC
jgi:hypothetical protein